MSFMMPLLVGAEAAGGVAATTGLFGTGGSFAIGTTLGTVGTGLGAIGAIRGGQADAGAATYNAEMARRDASSKEAAQRVQHQRQLSNIRASVGKSGATMEGTPLMVLAESAANAEIDALNTRYNGTAESNLQMSRAKNARTAGSLRAGTSLLSGMSRIL